MKAAKALWLLSVFLALLAAPAAAQVLGGPVINGPGGNSITLTTSGTSGAATLISGVLNIPQYSGGGITVLTGDVTASGTGSVATTVAAIQGVNVGTPTGTGNVVFSASPTFSGTINAANLSLSGTTTLSGPVVLTSAGTAKGFPFPEIALMPTTSDSTGTITPGYYAPGAGSNAIIGIGGYDLAGTVTGGTVNISLAALLPPVIPQGTLYLRQRYLSATTTGTIKATVSDAVVTNSGNPFTASLTSETQVSTATTAIDTFATVDTALTSTATANGVVVINYQLNQTTSPGADWVEYSLVIK